MSRLPQIQQFDTGQVFATRDRSRARFQEDQRMSRLREIGQLASQGDMAGAANQAFAGGDLEVGASLKGVADADKARLVDEVAADAMAAETPEAWARVQQKYAAQGFDAGDFSQRQALVNRALGVQGIMRQRNQDRSFEMQEQRMAQAQANSDRSFGLQQERLGLAREVHEMDASAQPQEPRPTSIIKAEQAEVDRIQTAQNIANDVSSVVGLIDSGKLQLGVGANAASRFAGMTGIGADENSRNFDLLQRTISKLRNDTLRLNKGVQTEGDAQRALDELLGNLNDPVAVKGNLQRIMTINERAAMQARERVNMMRDEYGRDPISVGDGQQAPPPDTAAPGNASGATPGGSTYRQK